MLFKKDDQGKNRDWKALEEGAIRDLHQKCKVVIGDIIKQFNYIIIPRPGNDRKLSDLTTPGETIEHDPNQYKSFLTV
jgi:hypothetical protein